MIRLDDLRGYPPLGEEEPKGLTLHDLGELLRRLGRAAGFVVQSEYHCYDDSKDAIDWVWIVDGQVRAAFELEGRDTDSKTFTKDLRKLRCDRLFEHGCVVRAVVFFQVNDDLRPKGWRGDPKDRVAQWRLDRRDGVDVLLDEDLLDEGTRSGLVERARIRR